jgi:hypothetical protein
VSCMWEYSLAPYQPFVSVKSTLEMRLGPHGKVDGLCGLVMGCHTHKEE